MKRKNQICTLILTGLLLAFGFSFFPAVTYAQEEVASSLMRYKQYEVSTGYYEDYEAKPQRQRPLVEIPGVRHRGSSRIVRLRQVFGIDHACLILTRGLSSITAGDVKNTMLNRQGTCTRSGQI